MDSIGESVSNNKFVRINYENDFFTATDYYFTQGIILESVNPIYKYSPFTWLLPQLSQSTKEYGLSITQDCFTPTNITSAYILKGDRPYAGYIYIGNYKTSANYYKKQMLSAEMNIGEIGACAECKQEQEAIHRWTDNTQPGGWQYQIGNGLLLNYQLTYEKAIYSDTTVDINALGQINAGTIYDNALAGFSLHLGKMQSYFLINHRKPFQLYGVVKGWVEGVAYNGTMQGALFTNNSLYTLSTNQINRIIYGDSYGICFSIDNISVVYSVTHITNEIETGFYHGWGHIDITYYF